MSSSHLGARSSLAKASLIIGEARNGRMFILVGDEYHDYESDFVSPEQHTTPAAIDLQAVHDRRLICSAQDEARSGAHGIAAMT